MDKVSTGKKQNVLKRGYHKFTKKYSKMERRDFPFVVAFLAFPVIHIIVFYFYVNFSAIVLSFQEAQTGAFTLSNFKMVFEGFKYNNEYFWGYELTTMLGKSVLTWIVSFLLNPIGWVLCYILTKYIPGSNIFRALYTIPSIVGTVVFSSIMKDWFSYKGLITNMLMDMGVQFPDAVIKEGLLGYKGTAFWTILIRNALYTCGGGLILAGAFMRVPSELFESASLDGCGLFGEIFSIAIPCVWTTISTMLVFTFCSFFTCDLGMYIYSNGTGAYGLNSIGFYIYKFQVSIASDASNQLYYTYSSAFGMVITVITMPVVFLGKWLLNKVNESVDY